MTVSDDERINEELEFAESNQLGLLQEHKELQGQKYRLEVPGVYQGQEICCFIDHVISESLDARVMVLVN